MSKRLPHLLIEDIIESGNKILGYTKDMSFDDFIEDDKTVDAVIRNFEIIGEAANRLPEDFKEAHSTIDGTGSVDSGIELCTIILGSTIKSCGKSRTHFYLIL